MADLTTDLAARVVELDARVRELEAVQQLILRIMSTTKPLDAVLEHYGATQSQEQAFYKVLDDLVSRASGREQDRPTFGYFELQLGHVFPTLRNDRAFIQLLIDTLKVDRPAYRGLYAYAIAHGWPTWT